MRVLAIGLMLISFPVFACPNLTGKYATCRSLSGNGSGAYDLEVTEAVQNRATVYTFTSTDAGTHERGTEVYRADGKTHVQSQRDPETGMHVALSTYVSCVGNFVKARMVLKIEGEVFSSLDIAVSKSGKTLTQKTTGNNMGEEINETVVCE